MIKKIMIFVLAVTIFISNFLITEAEEMSQNAEYDLGKGGAQTFYIENKEGGLEKVIIEEVKSNARIVDNIYKITYDAPNWTAGFYVKIVGNKITKAYSPFYSVLTGSISSDSLTLNNSLKATYAFKYKYLLITYSTGIIANIVNSNLVVSRK